MSARVLIADDDPNLVRVLRSYLEREGMIVFVAHDGETALHLIRSERPDCAVLDVMMPKRDGWALLRLIRGDAHLARLPVLLLTARVEDADKLLGLGLGADDYVTKPFNPLEVVARVKAVLRRLRWSEQPALPPIRQIGDLRLDEAERRLTVAGQPVDLTPTEFALLRTLMANPNYVFTRSELIEKALGYDYNGLERTIDTHIKNLRRKIEPNPSEPTYIETVVGVGYRLRTPPRATEEAG